MIICMSLAVLTIIAPLSRPMPQEDVSAAEFSAPLPHPVTQRMTGANARRRYVVVIADELLYGYGSIPIDTIFSGMNIHLPAILMFTSGTRF